jgi:hypothetical protein
MLLVAAGNDVRVAHDGQCLAIARRFCRTSSSGSGHASHGRLGNGVPHPASEWGARRASLRDRLGPAAGSRRTAAAGFDAHLVKPIGAAEVSAW